MTFAQISVKEIKMLHVAKASALEIIVYQVISSHIHSKTRQNAFPSLRRISAMIGGHTSIQSISRAISSLVSKGLMEKGKLRSKDRFLLIHRPVKKIAKSIAHHAKTFVNRYTPSSLSFMVSDKKCNQNGLSSNELEPKNTKRTRQVEVKPFRKYKKLYQVEKSKSLYEKRGESIWMMIAPSGFSTKIRYEKITEQEKQVFQTWVQENDTELKRWILENHSEQMEIAT